MNKFILALALVLAPFFSLSQENINIFTNGDVPTHPPYRASQFCAHATVGARRIDVCAQSYEEAYMLICQQQASYIGDYHNGATGYEKIVERDNATCKFENTRYYIYQDETITFPEDQFGNDKVVYGPTPIKLLEVDMKDDGQVEGIICPPEDPNFSTHTFGYIGDDGEIESCADPVQIGLVDDCRIESNDYLSRARVTSGSVCATLPNHSICKYDAVDVGGGQQAYQLDLEGDCYDGDKGLPKSDYVNDGLPLPGAGENGYACLEDGGLLTCSEDKEDVTDPDTGEVQDGCGTANIAFICISGDTDGDGLPAGSYKHLTLPTTPSV